jgi:hypothetical protein
LVIVEDAIAGSVALGGAIMESFQEVVDESELLNPPEIALGELALSP